LSIKISG